ARVGPPARNRNVVMAQHRASKDLNFKVDPSFHRFFKGLAAELGITMQQLLLLCVDGFLLSYLRRCRPGVASSLTFPESTSLDNDLAITRATRGDLSAARRRDRNRK